MMLPPPSGCEGAKHFAQESPVRAKSSLVNIFLHPAHSNATARRRCLCHCTAWNGKENSVDRFQPISGHALAHNEAHKASEQVSVSVASKLLTPVGKTFASPHRAKPKSNVNPFSTPSPKGTKVGGSSTSLPPPSAKVPCSCEKGCRVSLEFDEKQPRWYLR
ncbi:CMP-N-acetylneuraminate-beta-galactosamide- alpha-2,3-sialyltransferase [Anopheles sinensis]|uniref:CMP-N-acetylneuraminate-beta-galactosamide-alpha-2,3-sialyltransferase n=1 Tax=Anopheles sinensis TaxID=74873 RepID=A0A084VBT8_ANOSI|nr:CMP-N-acetylneuraminate-beta-galactosamide- alpha-2,3-sialyltransferase [Anopheles sinensis]